MKISTRGRYALRVLVDLAQHREDGFVPMKEVAQRQDISLKYLERILPVLTRNGFVTAVQGKGGGYRLAKAPEDCSLGEVLRLTEGDLAPVACLSRDAAPCPRSSDCATHPLWTEFYRTVNRFFDEKTLADLL